MPGTAWLRWHPAWDTVYWRAVAYMQVSGSRQCSGGGLLDGYRYGSMSRSQYSRFMKARWVDAKHFSRLGRSGCRAPSYNQGVDFAQRFVHFGGGIAAWYVEATGGRNGWMNRAAWRNAYRSASTDADLPWLAESSPRIDRAAMSPDSNRHLARRHSQVVSGIFPRPGFLIPPGPRRAPAVAPQAEDNSAHPVPSRQCGVPERRPGWGDLT